MVKVTVKRASSHRGDFPLDNVLHDDETSWWISANGSMPSGRGDEYMQFQLMSRILGSSS